MDPMSIGNVLAQGQEERQQNGGPALPSALTGVSRGVRIVLRRKLGETIER
jgi:hypothetical protein